MDQQEVARRVSAAKAHLEFMAQLYRAQLERGAHFRAPGLGVITAGTLHGGAPEPAGGGEWRGARVSVRRA
eukprot:763631-Alexandrium_andersonii.AAC.1